jgi:hypothetical protein
MIGFVGFFMGSDEIPLDEIEKRRDAALLRALSTPHKRQKEMKVGKRKARGDAPAATEKSSS